MRRLRISGVIPPLIIRLRDLHRDIFVIAFAVDKKGYEIRGETGERNVTAVLKFPC